MLEVMIENSPMLKILLVTCSPVPTNLPIFIERTSILSELEIMSDLAKMESQPLDYY